MSSISTPASGGLINRNIFIDTARGIYSGACQVIKNVKQIQGDPATFGRAVRIISYLFTAIAPGSQEALKAKLSITDNLTDSLQVFNSAHSIVAEDRKSQSLAERLAHITLLGSGLGCATMFMDDMGILALPKVAAETGGWNIFAQVTKSTLGKVANVGLGVGYSLMAIDSFQKFRQADKIAKSEHVQPVMQKIAVLKRSKALLNLIWNVSEVALKILIGTAVASTGALLVVGIIAAGLGICSFLYSEHVSAESIKLLHPTQ